MKGYNQLSQLKIRKIVAIVFTAVLLVPVMVLAHQPRVINSDTTQVVDPEISKAYYATLTGSPHIYTIDSKEAFDLYVGILVPDIASTKKDILAEVFKGDEKIATLGGASATWKPYFETFGQSNYFDGGEYKARSEAGVYTIKVSNPDNTGKYSLAVGEIEAFDGKEGMNALSMIPDLKRNFFEESPISFIFSPFGWGLIVIMYILAGIFGLIYRAIFINFKIILLKIKLRRHNLEATSIKQVSKPQKKNIGKTDRLIRLIIGIGLLLWAMLTSWSPLLIFISGFCIFEAVFSWCAFYAAIEKNTCSVE